MILRIRIITMDYWKFPIIPISYALLNPFQFIESKSVLNPLDHVKSAFYYLTWIKLESAPKSVFSSLRTKWSNLNVHIINNLRFFRASQWRAFRLFGVDSNLFYQHLFVLKYDNKRVPITKNGFNYSDTKAN